MSPLYPFLYANVCTIRCNASEIWHLKHPYTRIQEHTHSHGRYTEHQLCYEAIVLEPLTPESHPRSISVYVLRKDLTAHHISTHLGGLLLLEAASCYRWVITNGIERNIARSTGVNYACFISVFLHTRYQNISGYLQWQEFLVEFVQLALYTWIRSIFTKAFINIKYDRQNAFSELISGLNTTQNTLTHDSIHPFILWWMTEYDHILATFFVWKELTALHRTHCIRFSMALNWPFIIQGDGYQWQTEKHSESKAFNNIII